MTGRTPATAQDTADLQRRLARMPFAGDTFAPFVKAVEFDPLPPINAKGGRDCEGWVAVYEGTVQQSRFWYHVGSDYSLGERYRGGRAPWSSCELAGRHVSTAVYTGITQQQDHGLDFWISAYPDLASMGA